MGNHGQLPAAAPEKIFPGQFRHLERIQFQQGEQPVEGTVHGDPDRRRTGMRRAQPFIVPAQQDHSVVAAAEPFEDGVVHFGAGDVHGFELEFLPAGLLPDSDQRKSGAGVDDVESERRTGHRNPPAAVGRTAVFRNVAAGSVHGFEQAAPDQLLNAAPGGVEGEPVFACQLTERRDFLSGRVTAADDPRFERTHHGIGLRTGQGITSLEAVPPCAVRENPAGAFAASRRSGEESPNRSTSGQP